MVDAPPQQISSRPASNRSSSTQLGDTIQGVDSGFDPLEKEKEALGAVMDSGGGGGQPSAEGAAHAHVFPVLSRWKAISLVATMTAAMVLNVSARVLPAPSGRR